MASSGNTNANVIAFPDLPPKGSRGSGGKRALMGPEIGTLPRSIKDSVCSPITARVMSS
jgi:hypothetical protein